MEQLKLRTGLNKNKQSLELLAAETQTILSCRYSGVTEHKQENGKNHLLDQMRNE